jgi:hypothetical protein
MNAMPAMQLLKNKQENIPQKESPGLHWDEKEPQKKEPERFLKNKK